MFNIDIEHGFLPNTAPQTELPSTSELNKIVNHLVKNLPFLLENQTLRKEINQLNHHHQNKFIQVDENDLAQVNIAMLILLMLAQAYIWEQTDAPAHFIPAVLAKNIYLFCKNQQRFPILTYADYILHNWRCDNPWRKPLGGLAFKNIDLENLHPILSFTNSKDEAWFIKIHIIIEAYCAPAIKAAYNLTELSANLVAKKKKLTLEHEKIFIDSLATIRTSLQQAQSLLKKMQDQCNPDYYWNKLRHYLNGWDKIQNNQGYGVSFKNIFIKNKMPIYVYKGASGAQSSTLPALDAALNITHDMDDMYQSLLNFQQYMPHHHALIIQIFKLSKIKLLANNSPCLQEELNKTLNELALFRLEHLKLTHAYIYQPAKKSGLDQDHLLGTGGSPVYQYLSNRFKSTVYE